MSDTVPPAESAELSVSWMPLLVNVGVGAGGEGGDVWVAPAAVSFVRLAEDDPPCAQVGMADGSRLLVASTPAEVVARIQEAVD